MNEKEKMNILNKFLKKYGLSLEDEEVYDFFYGKRKTYENQITRSRGYEVANGLIKPSSISTLPIYFENASYNHSGDSLLQWFMYENTQKNPLVFENIGEFKFDIVKSFKIAKEKEPLVCDKEGNLFNCGDGNHRLLTLMIQHFVERKAAKSVKERKSIDNKYKLNLLVNYLHKKDLVALLENEKYQIDSSNSKSIYPHMARLYRESVMGDDDLLATYDSDSSVYEYNFNGDYFKGRDTDLIKFLKKKNSRDIMTWNKKGNYYISSQNFIIKTSNTALYKRKLKEFNSIENSEKNPFLVVKDMDKNTYDIWLPQMTIEGQDKKEKFVQYYINNLMRNGRPLLLSKSNIDIRELEQEFKGVKYKVPLFMPNIKYKGLTKDEYDKLLPLIKEEYKLIKALSNKTNKAK